MANHGTRGSKRKRSQRFPGRDPCDEREGTDAGEDSGRREGAPARAATVASEGSALRGRARPSLGLTIMVATVVFAEECPKSKEHALPRFPFRPAEGGG
jgi:hypothetical protein